MIDNSYESTYKYAYSLFNKARDYEDLNAKESFLRQAYGAAYAASTAGVDGAESLLNEIISYAKGYGIYL